MTEKVLNYIIDSIKDEIKAVEVPDLKSSAFDKDSYKAGLLVGLERGKITAYKCVIDLIKEIRFDLRPRLIRRIP